MGFSPLGRLFPGPETCEVMFLLLEKIEIGDEIFCAELDLFMR